MKIEKLFKKDIKRDIQGVVTIGNEEEFRKQQELEEYVCTKEVIDNFRTFFSAYRKSIQQPTDKMGVWITGFFGSGKSHFLKILGYLLSNEEVNGKKAVDYFDEKIADQMILADIKTSANQNNLVVLFNIDSKAKADSKNKNQAIMETMLSAFNEKIGLSGSTPWLAELERDLIKDNLYDDFKKTFEEVSGKDWLSNRKNIFFQRDNLIKALVKVKNISEESARAYFDDAQKNYGINTETFAKIIDDYCETNNTRVVFLIDEVGQFIGTNSDMMLNLQTVVEDLGKYAKGKAWVAVTSQQQIDALLEGSNKSAQIDFSKIQGRFATRLMMSSSNADEVIKKRLLDKTDDAKKVLEVTYDKYKDRLNNLLIFPAKPKWTGYVDAKQFVDDYPFVNYQYELLQMTFTAIRENGMSEGKHIASGERSLMNAFQKGAISKCDDEIGVLVPFNEFYATIEEFMDFDIKNVFESAKKRLDNEFDIEVLKVLFMLKNVKEMEPTLERLATLMVSSMDEDKKALKDKIQESLDRLIGETFAQQNGDRYEFLTNEEQDVNRRIKQSQYSTSEILNKIREIVYESVVETSNKFAYEKYSFGLNRYVDDNMPGSDNPDNLTVKIYTPWMKKDVDFSMESTQSGSIVVDLTNGQYLEELITANKIQTFDRNNHSSATSSLLEILTRKNAEAEERNKRAEKNIRACLEECDIYMNGAVMSLSNKDAKKRFTEALEKLLINKYFKLNYVKDFATKNDDISLILREQPLMEGMEITDSAIYGNANAVKEILEKIKDDKQWSRKTTMSTLNQKFSKTPYGYRPIDIRAMVAKLLVNNKVKCLLFDQVQSINDQSFIWEFSKGSQDEKIVIELLGEVDQGTLIKVKKIMKDAFGLNIEPKETTLRDEITTYLRNKLNDLSVIKRSNGNDYPGKNIIETVTPIFSKISNSNDPETIFSNVIDNEDTLYNYGEKIDSVINFYNENSSQMRVWNEAKELIRYYDDNKLFIPSLDNMDDAIVEMESILHLEEPFNKIPALSQLVATANEIKDKCTSDIVNDAKNHISKCLEDIKKETDEALKSNINKSSTKDNINDLYLQETKVFDSLVSALTDSARCANAKNKATSELDSYRNALSKILSDDVDQVNEPGIDYHITVDALDLIPVANRRISSKEDIDKALDNIREKLEKLLEENKSFEIK